MPDADSDQPSKRVFLRVPENYYDLSEAEQDEVAGQMADIFIAELGPAASAKPVKKPKPIRFVLPKHPTEAELQQVVNRIRKQAGLGPNDADSRTEA